jgi:hypothetical protein
MADPENKKKKTGFLEEDSGARSSMRLMSVISLGASIMFGVLTLVSPCISNAKIDSNGIILTALFLIGAFAPKAVQKFAEQKIGPISKISDKQ